MGSETWPVIDRRDDAIGKSIQSECSHRLMNAPVSNRGSHFRRLLDRRLGVEFAGFKCTADQFR